MARHRAASRAANLPPSYSSLSTANAMDFAATQPSSSSRHRTRSFRTDKDHKDLDLEELKALLPEYGFLHASLIYAHNDYFRLLASVSQQSVRTKLPFLAAAIAHRSGTLSKVLGSRLDLHLQAGVDRLVAQLLPMGFPWTQLYASEGDAEDHLRAAIDQLLRVELSTVLSRLSQWGSCSSSAIYAAVFRYASIFDDYGAPISSNNPQSRSGPVRRDLSGFQSLLFGTPLYSLWLACGAVYFLTTLGCAYTLLEGAFPQSNQSQEPSTALGDSWVDVSQETATDLEPASNIKDIVRSPSQGDTDSNILAGLEHSSALRALDLSSGIVQALSNSLPSPLRDIFLDHIGRDLRSPHVRVALLRSFAIGATRQPYAPEPAPKMLFRPHAPPRQNDHKSAGRPHFVSKKAAVLGSERSTITPSSSAELVISVETSSSKGKEKAVSSSEGSQSLERSSEIDRSMPILSQDILNAIEGSGLPGVDFEGLKGWASLEGAATSTPRKFLSSSALQSVKGSGSVCLDHPSPPDDIEIDYLLNRPDFPLSPTPAGTAPRSLLDVLVPTAAKNNVITTVGYQSPSFGFDDASSASPSSFQNGLIPTPSRGQRLGEKGVIAIEFWHPRTSSFSAGDVVIYDLSDDADEGFEVPRNPSRSTPYSLTFSPPLRTSPTSLLNNVDEFDLYKHAKGHSRSPLAITAPPTLDKGKKTEAHSPKTTQRSKISIRSPGSGSMKRRPRSPWIPYSSPSPPSRAELSGLYAEGSGGPGSLADATSGLDVQLKGSRSRQEGKGEEYATHKVVSGTDDPRGRPPAVAGPNWRLFKLFGWF